MDNLCARKKNRVHASVCLFSLAPLHVNVRTNCMTMTPTLLKYARIIARGKKAVLSEANGCSAAIVCGMLVERGLARVVKHRDHTRTYALTAAGKRALQEAKIETL